MTDTPPTTTAIVRSAPWWMWCGLAIVVGYVVLVSVAPGRPPSMLDFVAYASKHGLEGAALLWGAARLDLPPRLKVVLRVLGGIALVSAIQTVLISLRVLGGTSIIPLAAERTWLLTSYLLATGALLAYPKIGARRGALATMLLDLTITAGGIGVLLWTQITMPLVAGARSPLTSSMIISYGVSNLAVLIGLTVAILRGAATPSRRAFWWLVAGQAVYLPVTLLSELELNGVVDGRWPTALQFLGVTVTLMAMLITRADSIRQAAHGAGPFWFRDLNPLTLFVPLALGVFLIGAVRSVDSAQAPPLAITLTAVSLLLGVRLLLSKWETAQLLVAEAHEDQRRHTAVTSAVGRLAGGIAHEFNNLLTTVIGYAELGERAAALGAPAPDDFVEIRRAGERAAALTRQLQQYAGRQLDRMAPLDLTALLHAEAAAIATHAGPDVTVEMSATAPLMVTADSTALRQLVAELVRNARHAMRSRGALHISAQAVDLERPLDTQFLVAGPGPYAHLQIRDSGPGIPTSVLPTIFEPFFSTRPIHEAPGLGLAAVYGIVASHHGGLSVDSDPASGTSIHIYLPRIAKPVDHSDHRGNGDGSIKKEYRQPYAR